MLKIGLDWDDTIAPFNDVAVELANKKYHTDLKLDDITSWENTGKASIVKEFYSSTEIYKLQHPSEEAVNFVNELRKKADVYIVTAVAPEFMGVRAKQILDAFPDFPQSNIIMGFGKSLIKLDILLDDAPHNILDSSAKFPVLLRKPWNHKITGTLAVNDYGEFMVLLEQIQNSLILKTERVITPTVFALVGASGSGKNMLADTLCETYPDLFARPIAYSTKKSAKHHEYVSPEEFKDYEYIETTMYGGYCYGTKAEDFEKLLKNGINPVIPMDMCGAIALKRHFLTQIIFCNEDKEKIVSRILESDCSNDEKTLRILSIDVEKKNKELCDSIIRTTDMEVASRQLRDLLR